VRGEETEPSTRLVAARSHDSELDLPDPGSIPSGTLPVTVQVKNTQNGECWQAVYGRADKNEPAQFEAKSD
jgi:hypothetical protein